ncbi:MAG: hypothetical protein ACTSQV_03490 [Alphaproteobacteria bacterium]
MPALRVAGCGATDGGPRRWRRHHQPTFGRRCGRGQPGHAALFGEAALLGDAAFPGEAGHQILKIARLVGQFRHSLPCPAAFLPGAGGKPDPPDRQLLKAVALRIQPDTRPGKPCAGD